MKKNPNLKGIEIQGYICCQTANSRTIMFHQLELKQFTTICKDKKFKRAANT
jgi:hypothetical protein